MPLLLHASKAVWVCVPVMFDFEPLSTDTDINSNLGDNAENVFIFFRYQQLSLHISETLI